MPDIPPPSGVLFSTHFYFFVSFTHPLFICLLFLSRVSLCYAIVSQSRKSNCANRKMADSQLHAEVYECHYEKTDKRGLFINAPIIPQYVWTYCVTRSQSKSITPPYISIRSCSDLLYHRRYLVTHTSDLTSDACALMYMFLFTLLLETIHKRGWLSHSAILLCPKGCLYQ